MYLIATVNWALVGIVAGLALVAGAALVAWGFKRDDKWEEFSKDCAKAAGFFRQLGFDILAEALSCLAAKDWSGLKKQISVFRAVIDTEDKARSHMKEVVLKAVPQLMDNDDEFAEKMVRAVSRKKAVEAAERAEERKQDEGERLRQEAEFQKEVDARKAKALLESAPKDPTTKTA